jgi:hypothetical protein
MLTINSKLRTIVAISAVGAALASSGVASAAIVVHPPGTVTTTVAAPPTVVSRVPLPYTPLDPTKFGSATTGVTNGDCENLANAVNELNAAAIGTTNGAALTAAANAQQTLNNLCFQID